MLLDEKISRAPIGPYQRPMTSAGAIAYKTARDGFTNNHESVETRNVSEETSGKESKSSLKMERLSDEELKARRERALEKLKKYRQWKTSTRSDA